MTSISTSRAGAFFNWWASELRSLLPIGPRAWPRAAVILTPEPRGVRLRLDERGTVGPLAGDGFADVLPVEEVAPSLARLPASLRRRPVGVRVRLEDCLVRNLELPSVPRPDLERMAALDLARSTPLKTGDVLTACQVLGPGKRRGMVQVRQLVLKSRTIAPLLEQLSEAGIQPISIDCWDRGGAAAIPVDFLAPAAPAASPARTRAERGLLAVAIALAVSALAGQWARQEHALSALNEQTEELKSRLLGPGAPQDATQLARSTVETAWRHKNERHPATHILEEMTRIMPDTAWVEELRIEGDVVEIGGSATSAAALLPAFERSTLFHDARFAAPLRLESGESHERFRIRARLRPVTSPASAPGSGGRP
ncbi:MAG: PilN domain-containing protein [Hyphomicrobiaceae bacterium]|nr:PilN domain-containing protein [Hyphomicrobiaceae bacterium]